MTNQLREVVADAFELWFFRDITEDQRMSLFRLQDMPVEEITSHSAERLVFRHMLAALATLPTQSAGVEERAREVEAAKHDGSSVYHLLRSIRYNANFGSQDRPLHHRLNLIAKDAQAAIDAVEAAALRSKQPAASEGDVACFRMIGPDGEVGGWVNRTKDNYPLPILKTDWRWEFAYTSKQAAGEAVLAHEPMVPRKDMQRLYNAYVRLLESGRDRIRDLGGECDGVDVMERNDLDLRHARDVLTTPASDGDGGRVDTSLIETAIGTMQMTLDAQAGTMVTLHRTRAGQVLEALRVALAALLAGTP